MFSLWPEREAIVSVLRELGEGSKQRKKQNWGCYQITNQVLTTSGLVFTECLFFIRS